MTDHDVLRQRLAQLEDVRHQLLTGGMPVSIGDQGKTVTYRATSLPEIGAEIARLRQQLGLGGRRAIGVSFGR